ncbi:MAG TPA: bifunctional alpha/beta hydrolase/OsmC family protein [Caulobacteraceae bacterium]|jgi:putative redox protein
MTSQAFDFTGARSHKLSGRLDLPEAPVQAYALYAHCFTCTKNSLAASHVARALNRRGIAVLRFDFAGLGQSDGDFADSTFSGDVADLMAAAQAMEAAGMAPSLLIGHSLGGAAVLAAAPDLPSVRAVATIAAPFEVGHITHQFGDAVRTILDQGEAEVSLAGRPFTVRRGFIDDLANHDLADRIAHLRHPLLVLHAPRDETVGIENASRIFLAARHPKSFISLDDADHLLTRTVDADYAADVIATWAERYLCAKATAAKTAPAAGAGVVVGETGAGRYQLQVRAGSARFLADEPADVGGLGSGPTPFELVSAGLGACTAITLRMYADRKAWPLARVSVAVAHDKLAGATPPDRFERVITLDGDLDEAQLARLMQIADRCPVHRMLEPGATIETRRAPPLEPTSRDNHFEAAREACGEDG